MKTYSKSTLPKDHAHPCDFHLHRWIDRGWGEIACEYRWHSTATCAPGSSYPELEHCLLFEYTTYHAELGRQTDLWLQFDTAPFTNWKFRNPTDGRNLIVGKECFPATQGWAWDRHKIGGKFEIPTQHNVYEIVAKQSYLSYCQLCEAEQPLLENIEIRRTFAPLEDGIWRYTIEKQKKIAWMDVSVKGYVTDSAGIGISPWVMEQVEA